MRYSLTSGVLCLAILPVASICAGCDVKVGDNGVSVDVTHGRANDEWKRTYSTLKGDPRWEALLADPANNAPLF